MLKIFKEEICNLLAPLVDMTADQVAGELEVPPEPHMGEYAFPCYILARRWRCAPARIAADLAVQFSGKGTYLQEVRSEGPYLNFYVNWRRLGGQIVGEVKKSGQRYGWSDAGSGKTVVIDYSAPNIAKPFGVGHLRSTVIGNALYRMFRALGYRVIGINHLGDWGTQFGKLMAAFKQWGTPKGLDEHPVKYLYDLYVRFHREAEDDPSWEDRARRWFKSLEDGDPEALEMWKRFRQVSLEEFKRIYRFLGIEFDSYDGESFYNDRIDDVIALVKEKGLARESEGALVVDLEEHGLPPSLLRKTDGTTLYATRDLAAAIYRYNTYKFDRMLYVVGAEQSLYFQQLFKVLELLGFDWAERCVHVAFGLIHFEDGRMSTREGKTIFLEDVLRRALELAEKIIAEKNPGLSNRREAARKVGLGAIIFGDLINDRIKDVEFSWEKILDFSGETAPYIQYSHARICSILKRSGGIPRPEEFHPELMEAEEEQGLIIALGRFTESIERAAYTYKPSILARYLIDLAKAFNRFYHNCPVIQAPAGVQESRLLLIDAVRQVLANGLYLLGIEAPEEM